MECYKCDACAKSFTGLVCFQQHEASEKHKKKVLLTNRVASEMPTPVNPDQFHCPVCMVSIQGLDNYQKHVISLDHALNIQKRNGDLLSQSLSNTFELKTEQNQLMETTVSVTNHIKVVAPFAECKPCQKQFSGPEPYQQHLASAGHKKKCPLQFKTMHGDETDFTLRNEKMNNNSFFDPQSSVSGCDLDKTVLQPFAKCDLCQMQFSGALPYQMHLVSDSHKIKAGDLLPVNLYTESLNGFKCDICVKTFTGPVPYQQHLVSSVHKKKMTAADLSKQFATGSSIPDSTLKDNYSGLQLSSTNDLRQWFCEMCKKQCSGPIPYNSHILSQDHAKKLRILELEEKLRKIKESSSLSYMGNNEMISSLSNHVTSTADSHYKEREESIVEYKINNLNINVKSEDTKMLSEKFQTNANDLIALPNLNIIPPEKLDVTVFGPDDEIIFSSPKKCRQGSPSRSEKVDNNKKFNGNNILMVE